MLNPRKIEVLRVKVENDSLPYDARLSQEELCERAHVSPKTWRKWIADAEFKAVYLDAMIADDREAFFQRQILMERMWTSRGNRSREIVASIVNKVVEVVAPVQKCVWPDPTAEQIARYAKIIAERLADEPSRQAVCPAPLIVSDEAQRKINERLHIEKRRDNRFTKQSATDIAQDPDNLPIYEHGVGLVFDPNARDTPHVEWCNVTLPRTIICEGVTRDLHK